MRNNMNIKDIKNYFKFGCCFLGAKNVPIEFIMELCGHLNETYYKNKKLYIYLSKPYKDEISAQLGVSIHSINRYIKQCIDSGILFKTQDPTCFLVNQLLIPKYRWDNIVELKLEVDFKKKKLKRELVIGGEDN